MRWTPKVLKCLLRFYGPYFGAGVRLTHISEDWREIHVAMKLRWYNKNAVGSHFGGSIYSMADPHLLLMLMQILGDKYFVWDRFAEIEFVKPGTNTIRSIITISDEDIGTIREMTAEGQKYLPEFNLEIIDEQDELVARVKKTLYVRKKPTDVLAETD
jgi:acyl-coenzyme A thioesterase PaaI-like protein